jgi:hypothetical protein
MFLYVCVFVIIIIITVSCCLLAIFDASREWIERNSSGNVWVDVEERSECVLSVLGMEGLNEDNTPLITASPPPQPFIVD